MKTRIKQSLAGLLLVPALALVASVAVVPFAQTAGAAIEDCDTSDLSVGSGVNCAVEDDSKQSLFGSGSIFTDITNILLFIIGAIAVIMIIIGGIRYTISNGDAGAITSAKNTIMYAVIGLVVAILAFAIVNFVLDGLID